MRFSSHRVPSLLIAAAWILFVVSFWLPATKVMQETGLFTSKPLTGWQAFSSSVDCVADYPATWIADPRVLLLMFFPFANGCMLLAPIFVPILREKSVILGIPLVSSAAVPCLLPQTLTDDLFVGFWCWICSFFLMSLGLWTASLGYHAANGVSPSLKHQRTNCFAET